MKLSTSLVAVRKITSTFPRSTFAEDELEQAAKLILEAEGVINPIVVRRTSLESYEVVDGHFEYYAATRAREIDLRKGEMIGVFIIEDENEKVIQEQVAVFRPEPSETPIQIKNLIQQIGKSVQDKINASIDKVVQPSNKSLEDKIDTLVSQVVRLEEKTIIQPLEKSVQDKIDALINKVVELEEEITVNAVENVIKKRIEAIGQDSSDPTKKDELNRLKETLEQQLEAVNRLTYRVNLWTANKDEIKYALQRVKVNNKAADAAWEAIEYWKKLGGELTWENLKKSASAKAGSKEKISGFGEGTYKKLQEIGNL